MHLYRSNRMERLADALAHILQATPRPPFESETIVVQSKGMERWLAMELSSRLGIWANAEFPFPRTILERVFDALLSSASEDAQARAAFSPEAMTFSVARRIPSLLGEPGFEALDRYLQDDTHATLRLQLAERIAGCLDQYAVYRPEMVQRWRDDEATEPEIWQAALWRSLIEESGEHHRAARTEAVVEAIRAGGAPTGALPSRLFFFGIASLPPQYLEILGLLSREVEIHFFLLSPSREFWADIRSEREQLKSRHRSGSSASLVDELHFDEGHPLLASFGRLGRELALLLEESVEYDEPLGDIYEEIEPRSLLTTLQSDIFHLRCRAEGEEAQPFVLSDDDESISVHSCHGKMRELEVLRDRLYESFEGATLRPRDVIVMMPDIEAYAPMIEAVFEHSGIPYRIADRGLLSTHPVVDAFILTIRSLGGRVSARDVAALLGAAPIRERFGFDLDELETLRRWIRESGIRWGVDAAHREDAGQPAAAQNTWRFGLDRLLLGYAMEGEGERLFGGVLPYDEVDAAASGLLGRFVEFCETLFAQRARLMAPLSFAEWSETLGGLLEAMVGEPLGAEGEHAMVQKALDELATRSAAAGFDEAVDLRTAIRYVESELERDLPAHGFLSGGLTFCQLVPMRSIPFEVVAILGLDDDAFPRSPRPLGFDLMAKSPRPGDRNVRNDDRHMFLEALLSARSQLILSYIGQGIGGQGELPPSVVLGELLDELVRMSRLEGESTPQAVRERLVLRHPLTAFSPRYFRDDVDPRLFSYSEPYCRGARAILSPSVEEPRFLEAALPEGADSGELSIDRLSAFVQRPVRWLMQRGLGLYLDEEHDALETREPIALDGLTRWQLGDELLRLAAAGVAPAEAEALLRARGGLALGTPGELDYRDLLPTVEGIDALRAANEGSPVDMLPVDLEIGGVRLVGQLSALNAKRSLHTQFSKISSRHELGLWVRHLALSATGASGAPTESALVGRDGKGQPSILRFSALSTEAARGHLAELIELHREGARWAIPFFADASRAYADGVANPKKDEARALADARKAFEGDGQRSEGELRDAHIARAYPDFASALDASSPRDFATLALAVFEPLLAHRSDS